MFWPLNNIYFLQQFVCLFSVRIKGGEIKLLSFDLVKFERTKKR